MITNQHDLNISRESIVGITGRWLHNMSAPSKTTISRKAGSGRTYGRGVCFSLPAGLDKASPAQILARVLGRRVAGKDAWKKLRSLINDRAMELPLPPTAAVTRDRLDGDETCDDLLSVVTVMSKSSGHVYLRDKEPRMQSLTGGRRLILILPPERSSQ